MTTEFLELPIFPDNYPDQVMFFELFKTLLQNTTNDAFTNNSIVVQVTKATTAPSQAEFEAAWVAAGYTLPIPPSALFIWWNSATSIVGGTFGTTITSGGTVYSRDTVYPPGGTSYYGTASLSAAVSTTNSIGAGNTNHPSLAFTLPKLSDLMVTYQLYTLLSSGTGTWGADFLLDGVKQGTALYALPSNIGIYNMNASGELLAEIRIPNVAAGAHTIQTIMGVCGSPVTPPTIAYGGIAAAASNYGLRVLRVRAVTL